MAPRERKPHRKGRVPSRQEPQLQDTVRLSADGLAKVLGDLEARVLKAIWTLASPAPARRVHARVAVGHPVALITVVTVLNKLVAKRVLRRDKRGGIYHYAALSTEEEFRARASRRVVEGILSFGPRAVTASFVDVLAERNPQHLAELARLVRRRLRDSKPE